MNRSVIRVSLILLGLAGAAALPGCLLVAAGAAGAGTYAYVSGALESELAAGMERSASASQSACKDLGFTGVTVTGDALAKEVKARTGKDEAVSIKLTKTSDTSTKVKIRIGTFGDEVRSTQILDAIKKRL